jgi:hypothetical protein
MPPGIENAPARQLARTTHCLIEDEAIAATPRRFNLVGSNTVELHAQAKDHDGKAPPARSVVLTPKQPREILRRDDQIGLERHRLE